MIQQFSPWGNAGLGRERAGEDEIDGAKSEDAGRGRACSGNTSCIPVFRYKNDGRSLIKKTSRRAVTKKLYQYVLKFKFTRRAFKSVTHCVTPASVTSRFDGDLDTQSRPLVDHLTITIAEGSLHHAKFVEGSTFDSWW